VAAVLGDGEAPVAVQREAVRAGLPVLGDIRAVVAALLAEDAQRPRARGIVLVDAVRVGIAEEEAARVAQPPGAIVYSK
jgi:hypothetical protein